MLPFWAQAAQLGLRRQTPARAILGASPEPSLVANLVATLVASLRPKVGPMGAQNVELPCGYRQSSAQACATWD